MDIRPQSLQEAVDRGIISPAQARALWSLWQTQNRHTPQFSFTHVLYYLGGLLAVGALALFMNLSRETFGGGGMLVLCLVYSAAGVALTEYFRRCHLHIPAGICAVFVTALAPLAVYGAQQALGLWPDGIWSGRPLRPWDGRELVMACATLATATFMLWRYRYPFLMLPLVISLWCVSLDAAAWLCLPENTYPDHRFQQHVSIVFGLIALAVAVGLDFRNARGPDFPFWWYVCGTLCFWLGLSLSTRHSELQQFVYLLQNVALVFVGALIRRRVLTVFGALGVFVYCWHLADQIFQDNWLFPIALTLIGLLIVCAGVWWQKNEARLSHRLHQCMPAAIRNFLARKSG